MAQNKLKRLGQLRPANTAAASIFSPGKDENYILKKIYIVNVTTSKVKFRLFLDDGGSTYDEDSAIVWDIELEKGQIFTEILDLPMSDSAGNFAVRTDTNDAINFKLYGEDIA